MPDRFVGIDVGEDFLDIAIVHAPRRSLGFARVALAGLDRCACAVLAGRLAAAVPELGARFLVLVDSPRWPRDLDWSRGARFRRPAPAARALDGALRHIYRVLMGAPGCGVQPRALAMFPTPDHAYFARCARDPRCKPHLRAIAAELFGALHNRGPGPAPRGGAIFTRFMLAGFAAYRALARLGAAAFESYPDLQFRLSAPSAALAPKRSPGPALAARRAVVASLAADLGLRDAPEPANLDQADAAALALAAAASARNGGALWVLSNPCEGRFLLALDARQARRLAREPA